MLTDPKEIQLLSGALEPGIRMPNRVSQGPAEIVRDFMAGRRFDGEHVLELGPGHYELCEYVRARGGRASVVELDPCVAELGRRRGFGVFELDLRELSKLRVENQFDGLFCKGSNNPFWFYEDQPALERFTQKLAHLVREDGWCWIVSCPYSGLGLSSPEFARWLSVEREIYLGLGFSEWPIGLQQWGSYYGISVPCSGLSVYARGLPPHRWSLRSLLELATLTARRGPAAIWRKVRGRLLKRS